MTAAGNLRNFDLLMEPMLHAARIPGAAVAVVAGNRTIYSGCFGYRDLRARKPVTPHTIYPIASTTKAINATLLATLVDEGRLEWDAPVQRYLPQFRLSDEAISSRVTLRDLVTMRTGLPRHDWVWLGNPTTRAELVKRLPHLALSADFRQRFQYCNLSATIAGHIAEMVTGERWETLVRQRIFAPLGMHRTTCAARVRGNVTLSYHENARRKLLRSRWQASYVTAPSGGAVYSTIPDMTRWLSFNLNRGRTRRRRVVSAQALAEIHAPQVVIGDRPLASLPADAAYALGWVVDWYRGHRRLWHGGYLNDVNTSVMLFPEANVGMVSFTNFGGAMFADFINERAFEQLMGLSPRRTLRQQLAAHERRITRVSKRNASVRRTANTLPSHPLRAYTGTYAHAGYGTVRIGRVGRKLYLQWHGLRVVLKHWHHDSWIAEAHDMWAIHVPHPFDRAGQVRFHPDSRGRVACVSLSFEPEVARIRFTR